MCTRDRVRHQEEDADNAELTNVGIQHLNGSLTMQDPVWIKTCSIQPKKQRMFVKSNESIDVVLLSSAVKLVEHIKCFYETLNLLLFALGRLCLQTDGRGTHSSKRRQPEPAKNDLAFCRTCLLWIPAKESCCLPIIFACVDKLWVETWIKKNAMFLEICEGWKLMHMFWLDWTKLSCVFSNESLQSNTVKTAGI